MFGTKLWSRQSKAAQYIVIISSTSYDHTQSLLISSIDLAIFCQFFHLEYQNNECGNPIKSSLVLLFGTAQKVAHSGCCAVWLYMDRTIAAKGPISITKAAEGALISCTVKHVCEDLLLFANTVNAA